MEEQEKKPEAVKKTKPKKSLRSRIFEILMALVFLGGFGIFAYPTVSDQWNNYRQSRLVSTYDQSVSNMTEEDYTAVWDAARAFNGTIVTNTIVGDVFTENQSELEDSAYYQVLNTAGDGIMGYLSIPKINQTIPIYHGTTEEVLQVGVGHLEGTKLPIGGESTHSVLSAHRGLPSAKLFTDIDQLGNGDLFYIHILNEVLAYEVDQVAPMVDKDDLEQLMSLMSIEPGQDLVTLLTCTPYGVNSHRLLVRGHRVAYNGEEDATAETPAEAMVQSIQNYYMLYLIGGAAGAVLIGLLINEIRKIRKRKKGGKKA